MKKVKAWRYYGRRDLRLEEVELKPLQDDEVLIKVEACGICQTDVDEFMGGPKLFRPLPITPGHEFGGKVVEVGKNVKKELIGKIVTVTPLIFCNECQYCKIDKPNLCEKMEYYGIIGRDGGFAEYAVVKASNVVEMDDPEIIHFGEICLICLRLVNEAEKFSYLGKKALVVGAGPVGIPTVYLLQREGWEVEVCEIRDKRRKFFEKKGLKTYELLQDVPNEFYDVVIDCAGEDPLVPYALPEEVFKVKKAGCVIVAGIYFSETKLSIIDILLKEVKVCPIFTYTKKELAQLKPAMEYCKELFKRITCRVPFQDLEDALLELETRKEEYLKLVLKYGN